MRKHRALKGLVLDNNRFFSFFEIGGSCRDIINVSHPEFISGSHMSGLKLASRYLEGGMLKQVQHDSFFYSCGFFTL